MRFAIALFVITACSSGGKTPVTPAGGSGSAAGSAAEAAPPTEAEVSDAATAAANAGKPAAVKGKAGNAKLGAVVMMTDRVPVYCTPLESWPSEVNGKTVTAHGKLEQTDEFAAGPGAAGTTGAVWVLRDCKYDPPSP